jgi:hypothetical protein
VSINVVVSSTAAGVSVSGGTSVSITVSGGNTTAISVGGGIGPAGFLNNQGTATNAFGTFQLAAGDGITISTSVGQFQISSYGTAAVSSLSPVQSVAGRVGAVQLQASDVTAGTFAIARIPTISYTALANAPTSLNPSAHTHSTSDVVSFTAAAAAAAPVQSVAGRVGAISLAVADVGGLAAVASSGSYTSLQNIPAIFAPATHTHTASQVTDFTTAAAAAAPVQQVAGRTGDIVISTSDVVGLNDALANVNVDVIDGGDYVGVVVTPTPSITITAQPQAQSGQTTTSVGWDATQAVGSPATPDFCFYDGSSLWAGTATGTYLYKRSSGTWSANSGVAGGRYMAQTSNGLVTANYGSRTVFRSPNGGTSWGSSARSSAFGVFAGLASSDSVVAGISVSSNPNYGGSAFNYGDAPLCTSTDNGATWSDVSVSVAGSSAGALMRGITYANGRFVAVGVKSDYVATATVYGSNFDLFPTALTSTDGFSWNTVRMASGSAASAFSNSSLFISPLSVAYGGGKYIAVGASTGLDIPANSNTGSAGYTKPGYASANGTRNILTSSDNGATWSTVSNALPVSSVWSSIIYAAGQWVAFQASGNSYATSPDGTTWTARALPTSKSGLALYGNATYDGDSVYVGGAQRVKVTVSSSTVSATFTVSAYLASGTPTYQWQSSTDAGTTWANVSGATSATLSLSGLTAADNGKRYRCIVSATGVSSVTTNSATLTVT